LAPYTNFPVSLNPVSKRCAHQQLKKASLAPMCQWPSPAKLNVYCKKTGEKITEYECTYLNGTKMNKCINLYAQNQNHVRLLVAQIRCGEDMYFPLHKSEKSV
jgi:hypothetical protein